MADEAQTIAGGNTEAAVVAADVFTAAPAAEGAVAPAGATAGDNGAVAPAAAAETAKPAPAAFPDDWREQLAGGDDKALSTLKRYGSPKGLWDKIRNQEKALSARGPAKPGKDATPEEVAAWRKAEGIPETPDGYVEGLTLPDGALLGDDDKPVVASYAAAMHEVGVPQGVIDRTMAWYFNHLEEVTTAQKDADEAFRAEAVTELRNEFGDNFQRSVTGIANLFPSKDVMNALIGGRTADGKLIGDDPRMLRVLASLAAQVRPDGDTRLPAGQGSGGSIDGEIAEIEKLMRTDGGRPYWQDKSKQDRYGELLAARERMRARNNAA